MLVKIILILLAIITAIYLFKKSFKLLRFLFFAIIIISFFLLIFDVISAQDIRNSFSSLIHGLF